MGKLFGTDGIRGIVGENLTAELAYRIGQPAPSWRGSLKARQVWARLAPGRAASRQELCQIGALCFYPKYSCIKDFFSVSSLSRLCWIANFDLSVCSTKVANCFCNSIGGRITVSASSCCFVIA